MKRIKKIILFITLSCFLSCVSNKAHYSKFHKTHNKVKDNTKY
jgi:hypothetical protein